MWGRRDACCCKCRCVAPSLQTKICDGGGPTSRCKGCKARVWWTQSGRRCRRCCTCVLNSQEKKLKDVLPDEQQPREEPSRRVQRQWKVEDAAYVVTGVRLKEDVAQPTAAELIRTVPRDTALVVYHLHLPADLVKKLTQRHKLDGFRIRSPLSRWCR